MHLKTRGNVLVRKRITLRILFKIVISYQDRFKSPPSVIFYKNLSNKRQLRKYRNNITIKIQRNVLNILSYDLYVICSGVKLILTYASSISYSPLIMLHMQHFRDYSTNCKIYTIF